MRTSRRGPVFLSAGIPDGRLPQYAPEPDLIRHAILALVAVVTPKKELVFGGHPAISPLVEHAARALNTIKNVHIYQSNLFKHDVPAEVRSFNHLHWTRIVRRNSNEETLRASLETMRTKMIESYEFSAAVFIGGMDGIEHEWELFGRLHARSERIPVASTKGAALLLWQSHAAEKTDLAKDLRYRALFRKHLL